MYDELIANLRNCAEVNSLSRYKRDLMEQAADAVEELQGRAKVLEKVADKWCEAVPEWIPLTERLPEEHKFVLIRQDEDRMMVAVRIDGEWWYRYFAYDVDWWDETEQGTITHWMPLPEPPREDEVDDAKELQSDT